MRIKKLERGDRTMNRAPQRHPTTTAFTTVAAWLLIALGAEASAIEIGFIRFDDPKIEPPDTVWDRTPRPVPLWIQALSAPEADVRREAAVTIVLAHRFGMEEIETTVPAMRAALEDRGQHPAVVIALAHALIELDARDAASSLAQRATESLELAEVIEPALARWDYQPIRKQWLARLEDRSARRALLVLAIQGLASVGESSAAPRLKELAAAPHGEPGVRLAAARSLAQLAPAGLEPLANDLAAHGGRERMLERLLAASLLRRHASDEAFQLLAQLALDEEPAVASAALERLLEHDYRLVLPLAVQLAANNDANVRHAAAKAWIAERTSAAIGHLGPMLDDPHPRVRADVREALLEMAQDAKLLDSVLAASDAMLASGQWRGLEQSIMIMAALDQDETASRIAELLDFERPEVYIAAAWGLRILAVNETRPAILKKLEQLYEVQAAGRAASAQDTQSQHLAEAIRVLGADEALPLLRKYVPKSMTVHPDSRAAAIWTIGHLLAGKPDPDLTTELSERLADVMSLMPEYPQVREAAAVCLGRMKAEGGLATLRRFGGDGPILESVQYACRWAIHKIAGEPFPEFADPMPSSRPWFLAPVQKSS
jgi:HEAT repeat protein